MKRLTERERAAKDLGYRRDVRSHWHAPDGRFVKQSTINRAGAARIVYIVREQREQIEAISPPMVERLPQPSRITPREITVEAPPTVREVEITRPAFKIPETTDPIFAKLIPVAVALQESIGGTIELREELKSFDLRFDDQLSRKELFAWMGQVRSEIMTDLGEFTSLHIGIHILVENEDGEEEEDWIPLAKTYRGGFEWNKAMQNLGSHYRGGFLAVIGITLRAFKNGGHKK